MIANLPRYKLRHGMISLAEIPIGIEFTVNHVAAGWRAKTRLANLGIVPGSKVVKTRSAPLFGPVQVKVKGSNLIIGRGLARRIFGKT